MQPFNVTNNTPLTLVEELHILLLDRQQGGLIDIAERNLRYAFAGAVLMDLAKAHRIDTDLEHLFLVDARSVGDDILDPLLAAISETRDKAETIYWIKRFSTPEVAHRIQRHVFERLISRCIFSRDPGGTVYLDKQVSITRRYPGIPLLEGQDVMLRVMNVIFSEDIPSPDDTMLIALVDACGLFRHLLSTTELAARGERIGLVRNLDLIGLSVRNAIVTVRKPESENESLRRVFLDRSVDVHRKRPPMAPGSLPWIGHSFRLRPVPTQALADFYRSLGPVFRVRDLTGELTVLAGPEANLFCQKKGRFLFRSDRTYAPLFEGMDAQRIILSMDGEEHFRLRRAISSGFSRHRYLNRLSDIRDIILGELPDSGKTITTDMFSQMTAKSIGLACTGYLMSSAEVGHMDFFLRRLIAATVIGVLPRFLIRTRRVRAAKAAFFDVFAGILRTRLEQGSEDDGTDVVDAMLELYRSNPQFMPEHELRVSCLGPIFSGLHTTASTGAFAMYLLLRHPDVMEQVRAEADMFFAGGGGGGGGGGGTLIRRS